MSQLIQCRRDSAANWSSKNPILAHGEFGLDTTNNEIRIGDGVKTWTDLGIYISLGDLSNYVSGDNSNGTRFGSENTSSLPTNEFMYKSGFWDTYNNSDMPSPDWYWCINIGHRHNSSGYNFSGQIAIKVTGEMYFRTISTNNGNYVIGSWKKVWNNSDFATSDFAVSNHTHSDLHNHSNKSILDGIVSNKDSKEFLNGQGNYSFITWDTVTNKPTLALSNHTHPNATQSVNGFMSSIDKTKLDGLGLMFSELTALNTGQNQIATFTSGGTIRLLGTINSTNTITISIPSTPTASEYVFVFTCGSTPPNFNYPSDIKWHNLNGASPTYKQNKTYLLSFTRYTGLTLGTVGEY